MDAALRENPHRRIVVVEDDADIRALIDEVLTDEGYSVTSYAQATTEVFTALQARRPDLLICDLHIPGPMTGAELLRVVASDAQTRHIPIILCSAMQGLSAIADSIGADSIRVLNKPFEIDDFFTAITTVLDGTGGSQA
jgi:CheY-like chemotaxis protein